MVFTIEYVTLEEGIIHTTSFFKAGYVNPHEEARIRAPNQYYDYYTISGSAHTYSLNKR